jgi:hypothetical protein
MNANQQLYKIRHLSAMVEQDMAAGEPYDRAAGFLVNAIRELDAHLSAGGAPPEAWREGPDAPGADSGYGFTGWEAEADLGNDDDREGVHYLTITDPDGEECAVIVHRVCDGRYPLDGPGAQSKVRRAEHIVAALNRDVR